MELHFNPFETSNVLTIDLMDYVLDCDVNFGEYFKPEPTGLYIKNRLEPIFIFDKENYEEMFSKKPDGSFELLTGDFTDKVCDVYDKDGNKRIPRFFMLDKKRHLSYNCNLPYRAIKAAYAYAMFVLDDIRLRETHGWLSMIKEQFTDMENEDYRAKIWEGKNKSFESTFTQLRLTIERFVSKNTECLYKVEIHGSNLTLYKGPDKRIKFYDEFIEPPKGKVAGVEYTAQIEITDMSFLDTKRVLAVLEEMGLGAKIIKVTECETN